MKPSNPGERVKVAAQTENKVRKEHASGEALKTILNEKIEVRRTLRLPVKLSMLMEERTQALDMSVNSYIKQLIRKDLEENHIL